MHVLQLSADGVPQDWISRESAAGYYATDCVAWTIGDVFMTMRGGMNSITGRQSTIDLHPIIAVRGSSKVNLFDAVPTLSNAKLFRRDRYRCCYCYADHGPSGHGLTREHIVPTSRGGRDVWQNTAACCLRCNNFKSDRLLEDCGLTLKYLPYVPTIFESFILRNRNIRQDVHEWLASRVGKHSRWYQP